MKKFIRFLGGITIFWGILFLISAIYAIIVSLFTSEIKDLLIFLISMLFMAAGSVGLIRLGCQLYRKSGNQAKTVIPTSSQSKPTPPAPRQLTAEERKRQKRDAEERQRQWEEYVERRKKERAEFLEPWQGTDPADAEHIELWEDALEKDCAMSRHYVCRGQNDAGLDGTHDDTDADWFFLHQNSDLKKTIQLYAQIDTYRKACEVHDRRVRHTENRILWSLMEISHDRRILLLPSETLFAALGEDEDACIALCRKHDLMVMRYEKNNQYYNYVDGKNYVVYVGATFAGSADDAATYGALYLGTV